MFFKPFFFFQVAAAVLGVKTSILVSIILTILRKLASCGFGVGWFFYTSFETLQLEAKFSGDTQEKGTGDDSLSWLT